MIFSIYHRNIINHDTSKTMAYLLDCFFPATVLQTQKPAVMMASHLTPRKLAFYSHMAFPFVLADEASKAVCSWPVSISCHHFAYPGMYLCPGRVGPMVSGPPLLVLAESAAASFPGVSRDKK